MGCGDLRHRAGDVGQLPHRAALGLLLQPLVRLRCRHVGHRSHLVEGDVTGADGADEVREVPGLLAAVRQRPCGRRRNAVALGGPVRDGGRALVPEGLTPLQLRQAEGDLSFGGLPHSEELVELGPQLILRRGGHRTDQCGTQLTVVYGSVGVGHHVRTVGTDCPLDRNPTQISSVSRSGPPCSGRVWDRPSGRSPRAWSSRSAAPGGCSG